MRAHPYLSQPPRPRPSPSGTRPGQRRCRTTGPAALHAAAEAEAAGRSSYGCNQPITSPTSFQCATPPRGNAGRRARAHGMGWDARSCVDDETGSIAIASNRAQLPKGGRSAGNSVTRRGRQRGAGLLSGLASAMRAREQTCPLPSPH
jgi:hypothetical protein